MATVNIKKSDNSFERVADTLGIILSNSPQCVLSPVVPNPAGTSSVESSAIPFTASVLEFGRIQGNRLYVQGGMYMVELPVFSISEMNAYKSSFVASYTSTGSRYEHKSHFSTMTDEWGRGSAVVLVHVPDGGYLVFGFYVAGNVATNVNGSSPFIVVPVRQNTPYLVANKGALVSGGAFQFDIDGNGFTHNYPPVGEEWVVGKWIDGKTLYMQSWSGNIEAAANTNIYTSLIPSNIENIAAVGGWWQNGTNANKTNIPNTSSNLKNNCLVFVDLLNGTNALIFRTISETVRTGTTNNAYQVWIQYTKIIEN